MNQNLNSNNIDYISKSLNIENSEGGLDFNEIKNIVLRKIPFIAGCTIALTSLSVVKILVTPPNYVASFELLSEPVNIETRVTSTDDSSGKTREQLVSVQLDEIQLKILKSPKLILRAIEPIKSKYPELNYQELIGDLTIEIISNNQSEQNILQVAYTSPDRQKVSDVIAAITQIYLEYSVEKRQSGIKRGIKFLDQQIPRLSKQAKKIESSIGELRRKHNFSNPDAALEKITVNSDNLDLERQEINIELQELRLMLANLEQELKTLPTNSTTAIELGTPRYLDLLNELKLTDIEISQKSVIFQPNSIEIQRLNQEKQKTIKLIETASLDIRQKLQNQIKNLENRESIISQEITNLKFQLEEWSTISIDYNNLQEKLTLNNNKLNEFIRQKDALQIDLAQQDSPWQLLTPAGEPTTNNISAINYLLLSSVFGLLMGIAFALISEKQQDIIYTSDKIEKITNLPIIASIPLNPKPRQLFFAKSVNFTNKLDRLLPQKSSIQEVQKESYYETDLSISSIAEFCSFAVNLGLLEVNKDTEGLNFDTNLKSIAITSAVPKEGKSTVALNLARASALMGKRVLIVDTDFRNTEHLTKNLGLESKRGLRDILEKSVLQSDLNYIHRISPKENLFVLTVGTPTITEYIDNDPSRLFASTTMYRLMEDFKKQFDLVIYDLCSIIGFADVSLLATNTDGIIVVTGLGRVQKLALTEALNQLRLCNAPVLGLVVNKLTKG